MSLKDKIGALKAIRAEEEPKPDVTRPLPPHSEPSKRPPASSPRPAPATSLAALQPATKVHLIGFPLRLSTEVVDQLNEWKQTRGIVPGLLVRELVEKGIADIQRSFEKEGRQ